MEVSTATWMGVPKKLVTEHLARVCFRASAETFNAHQSILTVLQATTCWLSEARVEQGEEQQGERRHPQAVCVVVSACPQKISPQQLHHQQTHHRQGHICKGMRVPREQRLAHARETHKGAVMDASGADHCKTRFTANNSTARPMLMFPTKPGLCADERPEVPDESVYIKKGSRAGKDRRGTPDLQLQARQLS
jgi:hypothetical protein